MKNRIYFHLAADATKGPSVHFRGSAEVEEAVIELRGENIAILEIDGTKINTREDLFKLFAVTLRKPEGWYGEEEYAPNADAFLEYLGDAREWVPAKGHVVLLFGATQLWAKAPQVAGMLVELWQFAATSREAPIHLVLVW